MHVGRDGSDATTGTTTGVAVTKLTGSIGAVISGVELASELDDDTIAAIRRAMLEHHVVFFRDQPLTETEQVAFARRFGTVAESDGEPFQVIIDAADDPPRADEWHTDMTCWPCPPAFAFLSALEIPPYGGDTIWVDLCGIYESLSPTMQQILGGLEARHGVIRHFREACSRSMYRDGMPADEIEAYWDRVHDSMFAIHPLVRTHPETGRRALFVSERFIEEIVGLHPVESELLLGYLFDRVNDANFQVRWHWRQGDLAVWDEASTNHRALADHFVNGAQTRSMRRCTVEGSAPFFDGAPRKDPVANPTYDSLRTAGFISARTADKATARA